MPAKKPSTALTVTTKAKPTTTALTVVEPDKPALMPEFATARAYITRIQNLGRQAQHLSLLLGYELLKLKKTVGVRRGGDHTSAKAKCNDSTLLPWKELVVQQTGYSYESCNIWMQIAGGAKNSLPILTAPDVLETPFSELPEKRQQEVEKILHKAVDGQTMHEMMNTFGVWKEKQHKSPPKPTKESAAKRKANKEDEILQHELLVETAENQLTLVEQIATGEAFLALSTDRLAAFENVVDALKAKIETELKARRKGGKSK